ncbi:MAG TPA: GAF domain-containing SpoIIE family protein phosphatase [Terriglobales bacterium]|nr:GAF domain-containing SpoIIE family protein phosphatase [Terriglobales bacterium]
MPAHRRVRGGTVQGLLKLQRASQRIASTLDLDQLIDKTVGDVARWFGCNEANIYLHDEGEGEMVLAAVHGCRLHSKGHRLYLDQLGMSGWVAQTGQMRYAPDVRLDPYYVACEPLTRSEVDIPLKINGRVIGVFSVEHHELNAFTPEDLRLLRALGDHIAVAINNARRFRVEQVRSQRMSQDADEARLIQQALLPKASPYAPGFEVTGLSAPARAVGGDWYDYLPLPEGRHGLVLADVSGKGTAAALLMSATRAMMRSLAEHHTCPGEMLGRLNDAVLNDFPTGRFVTMLYGILDPAARTLHFASAGHPMPLITHGDGEVHLQAESGLPLGVAGNVYPVNTIHLPRGSRVLLYSDGMTEMLNAAGEEFGRERLRDQLLEPGATADGILAGVQHFAGARAPADDATLILIKA